jgi:hypothetical protein
MVFQKTPLLSQQIGARHKFNLHTVLSDHATYPARPESVYVMPSPPGTCFDLSLKLPFADMGDDSRRYRDSDQQHAPWPQYSRELRSSKFGAGKMFQHMRAYDDVRCGIRQRERSVKVTFQKPIVLCDLHPLLLISEIKPDPMGAFYGRNESLEHSSSTAHIGDNRRAMPALQFFLNRAADPPVSQRPDWESPAFGFLWDWKVCSAYFFRLLEDG